MVVTVASDILDGSMVATRSGIAGSYGHELMTVPSSAGHALSASLAMIESGAVDNVLLVGWGEATKFSEIDGRVIQADPFYARPVGADASALAAMQAQRLVAFELLDLSEVERYSDVMQRRSTSGRRRSATSGAAKWLSPGWSDGACALVLTAESQPETTVAIRGIGTFFQPYCPEPEQLDPMRWVERAIAAMQDSDAFFGHRLAVIETSAPTSFCEVAAMRSLLKTRQWNATDPRMNPSGGGAAAWFGPATGLQRVVSAVESLRHECASQPRADGAVVDMAGPIGQAVTVVALEAGHAE